jgi:hypothetical protein
MTCVAASEVAGNIISLTELLPGQRALKVTLADAASTIVASAISDFVVKPAGSGIDVFEFRSDGTAHSVEERSAFFDDIYKVGAGARLQKANATWCNTRQPGMTCMPGYLTN